MEGIKGIVFDGDNTLYRTREIAKEADLAAIHMASQSSGKGVDELYRIWSGIVSEVKNSSEPAKRSRSHSYSELLKAIGYKDGKLADKMVDAFEKKALEKISLNDGAMETIEGLNKNLRLFIVTEENRKMLDKKLEKLGIGRFFDLAITSDEAGTMKPSEKFYEHLQTKTGLGYGELAVVGDSFEKDLEVPKRLGMKTILLGSGSSAADLSITGLKDLQNVVGNQPGAKRPAVQAVILAAGESSRFWPLSEGMHKSMVKIMGKPIISWTIESLKEAGISDIIVVQSPDGNLEKELGDGKRFGVSLEYVVQPEPKGMGNALIHAEKLIRNRFVVVNAERFDAGPLVKEMMKKSSDATLLVTTTDKPWRYGILSMSGSKAVDLIEKPPKGTEPSKLKVVGIYLLPKKFFEYYGKVTEHTYAYEDALRLFMKENDVGVVDVGEELPSLKYGWDLFGMSRKIMEKNLKGQKISPNAKIGKNVHIEGDVWIGDNTRVFENAVIKGPCYIGNNCVIGNSALVRNGTNVEDGVMIGANAEVSSTILLDNTHTHSGFFAYSIIGKNSRIAAGAIFADRRIDRGEIKPVVKGTPTDTGMTYLGAIMGHNTKTGIFASFMPGVLVGSNCVIGANTVVGENVESNTTIYTKFEKVVKKNDAGVGT